MGRKEVTKYKCDVCGKKESISTYDYSIPEGWGSISVSDFRGFWLCPKCAKKYYILAIKPEVFKNEKWHDGRSYLLNADDIRAIVEGVPIEDVVA